jgi:aminoglycoside phosphotransferase (APT) family kinase protein
MPNATIEGKALEDLRARVAGAVAGWHAGAKVLSVAPLTGGASSLTYLVDIDGAPEGAERVVLKVAPPGLPPVRNRDVLRQARLMRALDGRARTLAPPLLFEDPGRPVEVPPFLVMGLVAGECVEPVLTPVGMRPGPGVVRGRCYDGVRVLADLHAVVPAEVGLGDEPVVSLSEEVHRWTRAFETLPEDLRGEYLRCEKALRATMPEPMEPVVNHGDYRLGNTLCEGERVMAVIDWEIWSVGDPRVDVTWFGFFTDEAEHPAAEPDGPAGTPTKAELIRAYEAASGSGLRDMPWFDALTKYKEAAATGLLIKRDRKNGSLSPSNRRMLPALPKLVGEALAILEG